MTTIPMERVDTTTDVSVMVWPEIPIACEWAITNKLAEARGCPTKVGCDRPAEWIMWRGCCIQKCNHMLFCTGHKNACLASEALECAFCGAMFTPGSTIFMLVEPIRAKP